jgi:hypothetical protein
VCAHTANTHSGKYAAAHTAACNAALKMSRAHSKYTHSGNYAAAHTAASNAALNTCARTANTHILVIMLLLKLPASNAALKTLRIHSKYTFW